jgi:hypothetical protein
MLLLWGHSTGMMIGKYRMWLFLRKYLWLETVKLRAFEIMLVDAGTLASHTKRSVVPGVD